MFIGVQRNSALFYTKTGNGRPLIMVHGNREDHTIFDEAIGVLKEHFTCYAIDSRGHGKSSPCRELHYKDMAADMIAFMTELDLTDVAFYGFSDGGIVGLSCRHGFGQDHESDRQRRQYQHKGDKARFPSPSDGYEHW